MWEIIALYFLTKRIGLIAASKGLSLNRWKLYVVFAWIMAEFIGLSVGMKIYNIDVEAASHDFSAFIASKDFMMVSLIGWGFAVASYFTLQDILRKKEDIPSKPYDINRHVND